MRKTDLNRLNPGLMKIDPIATGKKLKEYRRAHRLTQEQLSGYFELYGDSASRVVIGMWETGKKTPSISHIVFLAELYQCRIDELIISCRRSNERSDEDQLLVFYRVRAEFFPSFFDFFKM